MYVFRNEEWKKIKIVSWKQHKEDMNTLESSTTVSQSGAAH